MQTIVTTGTKSICQIVHSFPNFPVSGSVGGISYPPNDLIAYCIRKMGFDVFRYVESNIGRKSVIANVPVQSVILRDPVTRPSRLVYNGHRDFQRYGNVITNALHTLGVVNGTFKSADFDNEHGVIHASIHGLTRFVTDSYASRITGSSTWSYPNVGIPLPGILVDGRNPDSQTIERTRIRLDTVGISPRLQPIGTFTTFPSGLASECLPALAIALADTPNDLHWGTRWYNYHYSDIDAGADYISCRFELRSFATTPVGEGDFHEISHVTYRFVPGEDLPPTLPWAVGNYAVTRPAGCGIQVTTRNVLKEKKVGGVWVPNTPYTEGTSTVYGSGSLDHPLATPSQESPMVFPDRKQSVYASGLIPLELDQFMGSSVWGMPITQAFARSAAHYISDIRTIAPLPSGEALNSMLDVIKANHVETLVELQDIGVLLDPGKIGGYWFGILKGAGVGSVVELLDNLTSLKLLYDFMLRPSYANAKELQNKIRVLRDRLKEDGIPLFSAHGSVTRTIDLDPPFTNVALTATSKMVGSLGSQSVLAMMLGARRAGVYPSLANFWDCVPLSFAVDWFTNLDDRIGELDNQLQAMCFDISYLTHSFKLKWVVPSELLETYSLVSRQEVYLTWYRREKSRFYPSLRDSKFDWNTPPVPRNWGTIGSVVFQLAK